MRLSSSILVLGVHVLGIVAASGRQVSAASSGQPGPSRKAASSCVSCHEEIHKKWDASRHSKMVQPATAKSVKGDFSAGSVTLRKQNYGLHARDGEFSITESVITGEAKERRIDYTLGNRRIQHYLTTLEDGRIVVLPPSWDVGRQEWFHNMEIVAQEESDALRLQVWNKQCFGCHVSSQENNFDIGTKSYNTEWLDHGTACERCHGPATRHIERYQSIEPNNEGDQNSKNQDPDPHIVNPAKLHPVTASMVCAQCHTLRDTFAPGFTAGEDYFDYFQPLLEYSQAASSDPAWWPDGKTRRFSSNGLGLWQSECFLGSQLSCMKCHTDTHQPEIEENQQLRSTNRATCTRCHTKIESDVTAHTHHPAESSGSSCVECHMPRSVTSIKAKMRDHSISVPVPENTLRHEIPNACNLCHEDKSPQWAIETLDWWFPDSKARRKHIRRADAFAGARAGEADAIELLLKIADNHAEGPLPRANAMGYLGRYSDPRVLPTLARALNDDHPLVRAVAATRFGDIDADAGALARFRPALIGALGDERRIVRMAAAYSLLNLGVHRLEGEAGERFEAAKLDHTIRAATSPDHAPTQLELGKLHFLSRNAADAERAFKQSYDLDPEQEGLPYFLGLVHLVQKRPQDARQWLEQVDEKDPYFEPARDLLVQMESQR